MTSDGHVSILLNNYDGTNKDHNRDCCGGANWVGCTSACDVRLTGCFSFTKTPSSLSDCETSQFKTKEYSDTNDINFSSNLGNGVSNPLQYTFKGPWKVRTRGAKIIVVVGNLFPEGSMQAGPSCI